MKYYSEDLKKFFNTPEECEKAEAAHLKRVKEEEEKKAKAASERAVKAKEVEDALKQLNEARKNYDEKLRAFCKEYGSWHYTFTSTNEPNLSDIFWI